MVRNFIFENLKLNISGKSLETIVKSESSSVDNFVNNAVLSNTHPKGIIFKIIALVFRINLNIISVKLDTTVKLLVSFDRNNLNLLFILANLKITALN